MSTEPRTIRAGDSAAWSRSSALYLPADGWALAYRGVPASGGCAIDIAPVVNGEAFDVTLTSTQTATWAAGEYTLVGVATKTDSRVTVYAEPLTVLPNLMDATGVDGRSVARQIVAAIDEYFRVGDVGVLERQHADRMLRFRSHAELIQIRSMYAAQVAGEEAAERLVNGIGGIPGRFHVRM
jgi:hypothetical protein